MGTNLKGLRWMLCLPLMAGSMLRAEDGRWAPTGPMQEARHSHTVTRLPGGQILAVGGQASDPYRDLDTCEIFDPASEVWRPTASLPEKKEQHAAVRLKDGRILVLGGIRSVTCHIFDPTTQTWSQTGSLSRTRYRNGGLEAVELPDGRVLAVGGSFGETTCEIYDPDTGSWSDAPSLLHPHENGFVATVLPTGDVLVAGGSAPFTGPTPVCEIYSPAKNTWRLTAPMQQPRYEPADTLLEDGRVLVVGGVKLEKHGGYEMGVSQASCEVYDPVTEVWTKTASLFEARRSHDVIKLQNGHVIAAGGVKNYWVDEGNGKGHYEYAILSSAEKFDPASNTWSVAGSMAEPRRDFRLAHLRDGRILAAGGLRDDYDGSTTECELFVPLTWGGVSPNKVEVKKGFYFVGSKHDLEKSDGEGDAGYYIATSDFRGRDREHPITSLEFTARLQRTSEQRMRVYLEARSNHPGAEMRVTLHNHRVPEEDFIVLGTVGPTDKIFEFEVLQSDEWFGPEGQVRLRLTHTWPGEEGRGKEIHTFVDRVTFKLCE